MEVTKQIVANAAFFALAYYSILEKINGQSVIFRFSRSATQDSIK